MFDEQLATDVTFLLGEGKKAVCAHKFILISRSPVFYAMFEGTMSEKGKVVVPDIPKDIFTAFIRYLYTDKINLNVTNIIGMLYTAKKYMLDHLTEECHKFLNVNKRYVCTFLEDSHVYGEEITSYCRGIFIENCTECFKFDFTELCHSCVLTLTASDELRVREEEVYHAVMRWSEAECERQRLDVAVSRRQVLGDIIYNVRFPLIETEVLLTEVLSNNFLIPNEFTEVIKIKNRISDESLSKFKNAPRGIPCESVERFQRFGATSGIWEHPSHTHAISFIVSNTMYFHGVETYRQEKKGRRDKFQLSLYGPFKNSLGTRQIALDARTNKLEFAPPVKLEIGKLYTIV